ncbi:MAG: hypothetical protein LBH32_13890 [Dysgonamonadaceae bacterium]|jgi:hypothetical protein|nr:hypothetical protein [Dysgonamonadaceae bacterium]
MKKIFLFLTTSNVLTLTSCTTYYIPVSSLREQFAGIDSTKLKTVTVEGPALIGIMQTKYYYLANPVTTIQCVDKNGNPHQLVNSPSIETRFTYGQKNKKKIFYFDRIYVGNDYVYGVESRFIESIISSIPLDSITKIEIQDGHKRFKYIDN